MKFLNSLSTAEITDGQLSCTYQDVPNIFATFDQWFTNQKVLPSNSPLVFECINTLTDALVLLYLLEKGYSFLLLSKGANVDPNHSVDLPLFCQHILTTESSKLTGNRIDPAIADQALSCRENPDWQREKITIDSATPKLYLRTSGSTGKPKMAAHTHENLFGNIQNCVHRLELKPEDRVAIPVPIYHMYGLGAGFLPSARVGAAIDLQKGANLLRYLQREKAFDPNITFMTPIFCETLLKGRRSPRSYRFTVAAGDRVREEAFAAYEAQFGCLLKLYGSTEMGAIAAVSPQDSPDIRAQTVGQPMSGVQMRLDFSGMSAKEQQEGLGELWCYHPYGFEGYVDLTGQPTQQAQAKQEGWFRTKDLGRIRSQGSIEVLGRSDHSVNRDGLLVFFADVEKAIETLDGIESVVVISKGESQRGKSILAYCVLAQNATLTESQIRSACFDLLPNRAVPDQVFVVRSLPLLPNGKIDRQKLASLSDSAQLVAAL